MTPTDRRWAEAKNALSASQSDLVLLNEMPFGDWLPVDPRFDGAKAADAVRMHEDALDGLNQIEAAQVFTSRPIVGETKLLNEAFALKQGEYTPLHRKHFFPAEAGFYESSWFERPKTDFAVHDLGAVKVGVLLCTEIMFNEWARHYGRMKADLILVPRASGVRTDYWQTALAMAALVSGCYVMSSNRVGQEGDVTFGGKGFAYAPGGELLGETSADEPVKVIDLDLDRVRGAQAEYPCYVEDLGSRKPAS